MAAGSARGLSASAGMGTGVCARARAGSKQIMSVRVAMRLFICTAFGYELEV